MRLGRNDPCWCGSGKKYKNCHSEFDRKIREFEDRGHLVPSGYMIKTPAQIEGIREAGRLNTMVLDYAEQFINYVCREDVSAKICDYIGYATPSQAARKHLDPEVVNNFNAYPDAEYIANKTEMFRDPSDFLEEYDRIWTEIFSK